MSEPQVQSSLSEELKAPQSADEQKEILDKFLADPKTKLQAIILAEQIQFATQHRWFTIHGLAKKVKKSADDVLAKVILLGMNGLAVAKEGEKGTKQAGVKMYKIVITPEAKLLEIDNMMAYHVAQLRLLTEDRVATLKLIEDELQSRDSSGQ